MHAVVVGVEGSRQDELHIFFLFPLFFIFFLFIFPPFPFPPFNHVPFSPFTAEFLRVLAS